MPRSCWTLQTSAARRYSARGIDRRPLRRPAVITHVISRGKSGAQTLIPRDPPAMKMSTYYRSLTAGALETHGQTVVNSECLFPSLGHSFRARSNKASQCIVNSVTQIQESHTNSQDKIAEISALNSMGAISSPSFSIDVNLLARHQHEP